MLLTNHVPVIIVGRLCKDLKNLCENLFQKWLNEYEHRDKEEWRFIISYLCFSFSLCSIVRLLSQALQIIPPSQSYKKSDVAFSNVCLYRRYSPDHPYLHPIQNSEHKPLRVLRIRYSNSLVYVLWDIK